MTFDVKLLHLSMAELMRIYDSVKDKMDAKGEPGEFLNFYNNWSRSNVYKIPSGFLRFGPLPHKGAVLVHGIFKGSPFRDSETIKYMLDYYLEKHPEYSHVECHVEDRFHGVKRFVASIAHSSTYRDGKWIFHYGRN